MTNFQSEDESMKDNDGETDVLCLEWKFQTVKKWMNASNNYIYISIVFWQVH